MSLTIDLLFITYNRLHYTKPALASVLADPSEEFSLTIWDNASSDGTVEYLKTQVNDRRIKDIVLSRQNVGQTAAVNEIWSRSHADLLSKLDNDCIVTPGWTRTLSRAHQDIEQLGVVACWHFFPEDFDYNRAKHKIHAFGPHRILRHPWPCDTGLLIKRETFERFGPLREKAITEYWCNLARAGYVNGFYYPLIYQEHMDDPKSRFSMTKDREGFEASRHVTVGLSAGRYSDPEGRLKWREEILANLLDGPYDPAYYSRWRRRLRKMRVKLGKLIK